MEDAAFQPLQTDLVRGKKILIAPLNWGMGHATRCIPIINEALQMGAEITLASDGGVLALLKKEFPQLTALQLPAYNINYHSDSMLLNMALQWYKIPLAVWKERRFLKRYLKNHVVDAIISDNRYGIYDPKIKSVILTHQLFIRAAPSILQWAANQVNHFYIRRFDECWVPDDAGDINLSGELSHGSFTGVPVKYIGVLTRMIRYETPKIYDLGVILSGPEPQRSILEKLVLRQLKEMSSSDSRYLLVRGVTTEEKHWMETDQIEVYNFMTSRDLNEKALSCKVILCRSGYSSIMDLAALGVKAILIPTPGQTEQSYLAVRFEAKHVFYSQLQTSLNIAEALTKLSLYKGLSRPQEGTKRTSRIIASLFNGKECE